MPIERDDVADLPPEEFVAARDELARRLKAEGEADQAAEVKKLRKPTVTQWIAAQVRRHHYDDVDALRAASSAVGEAQATAITTGDRDPLRAATAKRREAVQALGRAVEEVLDRSGRPAHYRDEVVDALESSVTAELGSGTLGLPDDFEVPERARKEPARNRAKERRLASAKAAVEAAEARVDRAREELENAETALAAAIERSRGADDDA